MSTFHRGLAAHMLNAEPSWHIARSSKTLEFGIIALTMAFVAGILLGLAVR